ncbi:MDR family MFS transporter [Streptomyces sp. NPDC002513]
MATAPPRNTRWVLLGIMLSMFLSTLDTVIVGTAMPTITHELGGLSQLSWVVSSYTLAMAASTPIWAKLGDLYGRKAFFLAAITVFLFGSGLSGVAGTMNELIAFRALQGLGAGGMGVGALAIIGELVAPRERAKYAGMSVTVMAMANIGGPIVGGFITEHLGWRWAFYLNLPVGVIALVWCQVMLRLTVRRKNPKVDYVGGALLMATTIAIVLVTNWGGTQYAWGSPHVLVPLAVAVIGLPVFVWSQTLVPEPIMPPALFAKRNFTLAMVMTVVGSIAMFGAITFLPLFQQTVQGASASNSGQLLLPLMGSLFIVSQLGGRLRKLSDRYKIYPILGSALLTAACIGLATMDTTTGRLTSGVYMAVLGAGIAFMAQTTTLIAQNSVEMKDMGAASGSTTLFRTLGGSFGVALFGALFNAQVGHTAAAGVRRNPAALRAPDLHTFTAGIQSIFTWAAVLCAIAFVAALFIVEVPLRQRGALTPANKPGTAGTPDIAATGSGEAGRA